MSDGSRSDSGYSRRGVLSTLGAVSLLGLTGMGSVSGARHATVDSTTTGTAAESSPPTAWTETYGGDGTERLSDVVETGDGGYLAVGQTKGPDTADSRDGWIVKLEGDGTEQWTKILGGELRDDLAAVIETSDGGYLAAGETSATDFDDQEGWFVKMAADGTEEWNRTYEGPEQGGYQHAGFAAVTATSDGGYLAAGYAITNPISGKDRWDGWLLKTAADGTKQWSEIYGRIGQDDLFAVTETSEGDYLAAGRSISRETETSSGWIVKTAADGTEQWSKLYGDDDHDELSDIIETGDGSYLAAGTTLPLSQNGSGWLVKTATDGTETWSNTYDGRYAGDRSDTLSTVLETDDGYLAAGGSYASDEEWMEGWLLKTATDGTEEWTETWGGTNNDELFALIETADGGYLAAGETSSFGAGISDGWVVKVGGEDPEDGPSVADYANDDDIVDTDGLRAAVNDWRAGDIDTALLRDVIEAWRSGDPVP